MLLTRLKKKQIAFFFYSALCGSSVALNQYSLAYRSRNIVKQFYRNGGTECNKFKTGNYVEWITLKRRVRLLRRKYRNQHA